MKKLINKMVDGVQAIKNHKENNNYMKKCSFDEKAFHTFKKLTA